MSDKSPSGRKFGLVIAGVFLILAATVHFRSVGFYILSILVIILLALSLTMPRVLAPLKRLRMKLGLLLNKIVSPIFLALVYVLAIIPVGAFGMQPGLYVLFPE